MKESIARGDVIIATRNGSPYYRKGDTGTVVRTYYWSRSKKYKVYVDFNDNKKVYCGGIWNISLDNCKKVVPLEHIIPIHYYPR